jgi:hypothetical protein
MEDNDMATDDDGADWTENEELTEPDDAGNAPIMGVTGGQRAREGDLYVVQFHDNGETTVTEQGDRVRFDAELVEASFSPVDGDGDALEPGDDIVFMTGSSRFLNELMDVMPVRDKAVRVEIDGVGYDAEYSVAEA